MIVESLGGQPIQIVVERAMSSDAQGVRWAAGTNALATKLQEDAAPVSVPWPGGPNYWDARPRRCHSPRNA